MKRLFFICCCLFQLIIGKSYSQNQSECEYGYCSHCEQKFVYRAWVDHSFNRKDDWTFNRNGVFDPSCNAQVKNEKANQATFDQRKEKEKNGLKAIDWWSNGKVKVCSDGDKFAYYTSSGIIVEKYENGKLFFYENGKLISEGPALRDRNYVRAFKHGKWIEDGKAVMYDYDKGHVMTEAELKEEEILNSSSVSTFAEYWKLRPFFVVFEPNSYNTPSNYGDFLYKQLAERLNKMAPEITTITVVAHSKKISGEVDDNAKKSLFLLGLNRAYLVEQELKKRVPASNIKWVHIACYDKLVDDYSDYKNAYPTAPILSDRTIEVYVNFKPARSTDAYEDLKNTLGYQSVDSIIPNHHLIRTLTWNIYMKIYGRGESEILENIPVEFRNNIHIKKAIQMAPEYFNQIDNGELTIEEYKSRIKLLKEKITLETFDKNIY